MSNYSIQNRYAGGENVCRGRCRRYRRDEVSLQIPVASLLKVHGSQGITTQRP